MATYIHAGTYYITVENTGSFVLENKPDARVTLSAVNPEDQSRGKWTFSSWRKLISALAIAEVASRNELDRADTNLAMNAPYTFVAELSEATILQLGLTNPAS